jgi:hypothetical protein
MGAMKRDMDLIRELLLKLESLPLPMGSVFIFSGRESEVSVGDFTADAINYHLNLLQEAGLIESPGSGTSIGVTFARLSWAGHDFLDNTRDPDIWEKSKSRAQTVAGVGLGLLLEIAKAEIKARLHLQ